MKWRLAIIVCSYVIGVGFLAAWHIEGERQMDKPPNGVFNPKSIIWMMKTGFIFLSIGTTVLVHLIADKIPMLMKVPKKSGHD